jgi:hypothetical protein
VYLGSSKSLNISFSTQTNFTYQLEVTTNLTDAVWIPLEAYAGSGGVVTFGATNGASRQFYRVRVQ